MSPTTKLLGGCLLSSLTVLAGLGGTLRESAGQDNSSHGLTGQVVDSRGEPVSRAEIHVGSWTPQQPKVICDERGQFALTGLTKETVVIAAAPKHAIEAMVVEPKAATPVKFVLSPSRGLRLRVEDLQGNPLEGVLVQGDDWRKTAAFVRLRTDHSGRVHWDQAPNDPVEFMVTKLGHAQLLNISLSADQEEQRIVLPPELLVSGVVTDRATGKPIPEFRWMPVSEFNNNSLQTARNQAKTGRNGMLEARFDRIDVTYRLRVEADGYRACISSDFQIGEPTKRIHLELEPAPAVQGQVSDASGRPVANVIVTVATRSQPAQPFVANSSRDQCQVSSAKDGSFSFAAQAEDYTLFAACAEGYAWRQGNLKDTTHRLMLQPWGQVRGRVTSEGRGVPRHLVMLENLPAVDSAPTSIMLDQRVVTDEQGNFAFSRVVSGNYRLHADLSIWRAGPLQASESIPFSLAAGKVHDQTLGNGPARVTARVALADDGQHDFSYSLNYLVAIRDEDALGSGVALGSKRLAHWSPIWTNTQEGRRWLAERRHWFVKLSADGSLNVSGVSPGKYMLLLQLFEPPEEGCLVLPYSLHQRVVEIPQAGLDLGTLKLSKLAGTHVGDRLAELPLTNAAGERLKLTDYQGKVILLELWASWCGACLKQSPQVRALAKRYQEDDRGYILGINLDEDRDSAKAAIRKHQLDWPQAFVEPERSHQAMSTMGCTSLPAYLVVDRGGILRYRGPNLATAQSILERELAKERSGQGK